MNKTIHEARTSRDLLRRRVYQMYDRGSLGNTPFYNVTKILRFLRKTTPKRKEDSLTDDDIISAAEEIARSSRKNFIPTRTINDIEDEENDSIASEPIKPIKPTKLMEPTKPINDYESEISNTDSHEDTQYLNSVLNPEFKSSDDLYVYSSADGSLRIACASPELDYDGSVKQDLTIADFTPNNIVKFMDNQPSQEEEEEIVIEPKQYYISNSDKYKNPKNCYQEMYYKMNGLK
jgi:hypothetical protein